MKELTTDWFASVTTLKGVGEKIAEKLTKLQIFTIGDLLLHCPYRYEDRTHLTPIHDLLLDQSALVQGKILSVNVITKGKKRAVISLADKTGVMEIVFFNFQPVQQKQWRVGATLRCYGQTKQQRKGLQMVHPDYEIIDEHNPQPLPAYLTPVYPTVAGLWQGWLRKLILQILDLYTKTFGQQVDLFARSLMESQAMPHWIEALNTIHRPRPDQNVQGLIERQHPAYTRLIIEEFYAHHLSMSKIRQQTQIRETVSLPLSQKQVAPFFAQLPFALTGAQQKVWEQIQIDIAGNTAMLRLVQGDVGCGKTVVAALAALASVTNGYQVAIMVPTEILAEQHFTHFNEWFTPLGYRCEVLTGRLKSRQKRNVQENITLGLANIVIGTHALFQEDTIFQSLGLVIIDEQHRFGVHQRLQLQSKGKEEIHPHQLIMTATPIPRTLAMSHYAHLDISIIDSLPPGRQPISTLVIPQSRREAIIERMNAVCEKGQQAYWVCTLIEESDALDCQNAQASAELLQKLLPKYRIGLVHGKMNAAEKSAIMQDFYQGTISILVATTVIEVGVNVPNATLMVIENPERLGLAQLHQLRGRVGRGSEASFCILLYQSPLSEMAQSRLQVMRESTDGFVIAEADLALRGPGEVLGTRQTGMIRYKVADLVRDNVVFKSLATWKDHLTGLPQEELDKIMSRWCSNLEYAQA